MAEEEDRISSLPDCLLLEIISRIKVTFIEFDYPPKEKERLMTTKEVIKTTSTISKRWQHLWTKLPNLEICYDRFQDSSDYTGHVSRMSKTLTQCPTDVNLNKFTLHFEYTSNDTTISWFTSQINSWIRHAITRNVQEVDLWLCNFTLGEFSCDGELFFNNSCITRMNIMASCKFNPPNGKICWDKLKFLHIFWGKLDGDSIGKILSGSPCLETLELENCSDVGRIDTTSKRFKNLVLTDCNTEYRRNYIGADYIDTFEINAPYMLSLTIKGKMCFENFLLLDVSSLVKADLNYRGNHHFADKLGRRRDDIEDELLRGLLSSLGHVNEIALGNHNCLKALSRLEATGFQFRKASRGIAAHYSGKVFVNDLVRHTIGWLNAIREWQEEFAGNMSSREFVDTVTKDLLDQKPAQGCNRHRPCLSMAPLPVLANAEGLSSKSAFERHKQWLKHVKTRSARHKIMKGASCTLCIRNTADSVNEFLADAEEDKVVEEVLDYSKGTQQTWEKILTNVMDVSSSKVGDEDLFRFKNDSFFSCRFLRRLNGEIEFGEGMARLWRVEWCGGDETASATWDSASELATTPNALNVIKLEMV
nr:hypothetical protein [Tanacetum cinerariifolium]